jgi:hypothetical protein
VPTALLPSLLTATSTTAGLLYTIASPAAAFLFAAAVMAISLAALVAARSPAAA